MITIRCTAEALRYIDQDARLDAPPGTGALGDWYMKVVPTAGGDLCVFVSERTLLTVAVPADSPMVLDVFVARVANLLVMMRVPGSIIDRELEHYSEIRLGRPDPSALSSSLDDIGDQYRTVASTASPGAVLSLSDVELALANLPHDELAAQTAYAFATELLVDMSGAVN